MTGIELREDAVIEKRDSKSVVLRHDARELPLSNESVDLIITSPPYWGQRSYREGDSELDGQIGQEPKPSEFLVALDKCMSEWRRILKPTGSAWVNIGDKYAGSGGGNQSGILHGKRQIEHEAKTPELAKFHAPKRYIKESEGVAKKSLLGIPWRFAISQIDQGWVLRAEVIWSKLNGMPEPIKDRARRSHEQWFHFTKAGDYYADMSAIEAMEETGSVWPMTMEPLHIPTAVKTHFDLPEHFAAFPTEIPRRIVLGWSPPGSIVLDPFGGTGTVAGVARALGRFGISNDLSEDYNRLAVWRIWRSGHFRKVENRAADERQRKF